MIRAKNNRKPILVIGGYGEVGRHVAERILTMGSAEVSVAIAGRDRRKADALAAKLGQRAQAMTLDATDADAVGRDVAASRVVILCTEAGSDVVTEYFIKARVPLASVAASSSILRSLASRNLAAQSAGVTLVKDVGLAPGLIQMIAIECFEPADETTCITLIVELCVIGRHRWEAIAWIFEQAASASGTVALVSPIARFQSTLSIPRRLPAESVLDRYEVI